MIGGSERFLESDVAAMLMLVRLMLVTPSCRELGDSPGRIWMLMNF